MRGYRRPMRPRTRLREKVLVVGGGVAALEATLALRELAGDLVETELWAPRPELVYRPFAVGEPFGAADVLRYDLDRLADACGASFHLGGISSVDPVEGIAVTRDGETLAYDRMLLAPGARMLWAVPGAVTFWGIADEGAMADLVRGLRAGSIRDVVFTMPGGCSWALPLYELAFLAAAVLARSGVADARVGIVTPEEAPLRVFGRPVAERMEALLEEHGIELLARTHPVEFADGLLQVAPGEPVEAEAVVSLPRLEGRRIDGVPHDEEGFVPIDSHGRVVGTERLYAAGDVTTFPVKQGGIATEQADAAAEAIAAEAGAAVEPAEFDPILRGVLWTGEGPRFLRGHLAGGHGETAVLSEAPPWPDWRGKIVGRHLTPFLADVPDEADRRVSGSQGMSSSDRAASGSQSASRS